MSGKIPKFEAGIIPANGTTDYIRFRTSAPPGAWITYTLPTVGLASHTHLKEAFDQAMITSYLTLTIDHTSGLSSIAWTPAANVLDVEMTTAVADYLGFAVLSYTGASPWTSTARAQGLWYPTLPLVSEQWSEATRASIAWHLVNEQQSATAAPGVRLYEIVTRVSNTAGTFAEYQYLYDFIVNFCCSYRPISYFPEYTDSASSSILLYLESIDMLTFNRKPANTNRYFDVELKFIQSNSGLT